MDMDLAVLTEREARLVQGITAGLRGKKLLEASGYSHASALQAAKTRDRVQRAIAKIREQRMLDLGQLAGKSQAMLAQGVAEVDATGTPEEKMRVGAATMKVVADVNGKLPAQAAGITGDELEADRRLRILKLAMHIRWALAFPDRARRLAKRLDVTGPEPGGLDVTGTSSG